MANPVSHEDLMNTLGKRINDILEPLLPTDTTIVYDNMEEPDTLSNPWIRVAVLHGGNFQADIGTSSHRYRRMGIILFQLFGKLHVGTKALSQLVVHIETVFRGKKVDGVSYITPDIINLGRVGKWYQYNVFCPFWVDVF